MYFDHQVGLLHTETWGFPVGKLGSTRLPVMVCKWMNKTEIKIYIFGHIYTVMFVVVVIFYYIFGQV